MRKGFLGCLTALLAGAGLAAGQTPASYPGDPAQPSSPPAGKPILLTGSWVSSAAPTTPTASAATVHPIVLAKDEVSPLPPPKPVEGTPPAEPGASLPDGGPAAGGSSDHFWVNVEYLLWWQKNMRLPPLVTTGPPVFQGILGLPGTTVLFGGDVPVDEEGRSGFRVTGGVWLDCEKCWGLEFSGFLLPQRDNVREFGGNFSTFLARPFFSLNTMMESSEITSQMGLAKGTTTVRTPSRLWGAELNCVDKLCCGCYYRVDLITGPRYLDLDEAVEIGEFIKVNTPLPPQFQQFNSLAGATIQVLDRFKTRNQFYGGQAGLDAAYAHGPWQVGVRGKVALGATQEIVDIIGNQVITFPNGTVSKFTGGLLALPSNIGHFSHSEFAVVPEINVNLGYRFTNCLCAYVGYNFLYWSRVARPGDQIDRVIDTTQIPNFAQSAMPTGINRPTVPFRQSDYWVQGLNVGLEVTW